MYLRTEWAMTERNQISSKGLYDYNLYLYVGQTRDYYTVFAFLGISYWKDEERKHFLFCSIQNWFAWWLEYCLAGPGTVLSSFRWPLKMPSYFAIPLLRSPWPLNCAGCLRSLPPCPPYCAGCLRFWPPLPLNCAGCLGLDHLYPLIVQVVWGPDHLDHLIVQVVWCLDHLDHLIVQVVWGPDHLDHLIVQVVGGFDHLDHLIVQVVWGPDHLIVQVVWGWQRGWGGVPELCQQHQGRTLPTLHSRSNENESFTIVYICTSTLALSIPLLVRIILLNPIWSLSLGYWLVLYIVNIWRLHFNINL